MNNHRYLFYFFILLCACAGKPDNLPKIKTGIWRATIEIQGQQLPFTLEVAETANGNVNVFIQNAEERLRLDEVYVNQDSINIVLHIFDANIKAKIKGDTLIGEFIKNYETDFNIPFHAVHGQAYRFEKGMDTEIPDFNGTYKVTFLHEADTTPAIGIFNQQGDSVTGTFLTPTGDYRYLAGNVANGMLQLSAFDGNHAFLFTASKQADGKLVGEFYSGKTWMEFWVAEKDDHATLPDAESLTFLKEGFDRVDFNFPTLDGTTISLTDKKYQQKVVILQLFGTWCPNCMDETLFLAPWYEANKSRGVEIIGLAYERKTDFTYASNRVKKMIDKFNVTYDFAIAGTNDKQQASETLPMLNKVVAFPTTIFIGKDGKVKKINTGFTGPGTGLYYDQFVEQFNQTINELLSANYTSTNN